MRTWVYGKSTPGWYVAKQTWDDAYSQHLISLGYQVQRSDNKPVEQITIAEKYGEITIK